MAFYKTLALVLALSASLDLGATSPVAKLSEIKSFRVCGNTYKLEVAKTNADRSRGMMYRTDVSKDEGMLFVFAEASPQSFWMKNVPIPLDILYFDAKGKLLNHLSMATESPVVQDQFLKQYSSKGASQFVVELRHGTVKTFSAKQLKDCRLDPLYKIDASVER